MIMSIFSGDHDTGEGVTLADRFAAALVTLVVSVPIGVSYVIYAEPANGWWPLAHCIGVFAVIGFLLPRLAGSIVSFFWETLTLWW